MRWRYGLAAELIAVAWALGVCAIGVIVLSGMMRARSWAEVAMYVLMGAAGAFVATVAAALSVQTTREGRDGDVPERGQGRGSA